MAERITIVCPHCGKAFFVLLDELSIPKSVFHEGTGETASAKRFRISCPYDGNMFLIDISEDGGIRTYLQGDSTTDAPPPDVSKEKGK